MPEIVIVREAKIEDCKEIWEWWNDPVTRKMMKKNDYVPWEEHCEWFNKVLTDNKRILCVGLVNDQKIGVVRFDLKTGKIYEVSINLNPVFRNRGYGSIFMKESIRYLSKIRDVKRLFAMLKKVNIPSKKTFEKAGFIIVNNPKEKYSGMEQFLPETEYYCELILDK